MPEEKERESSKLDLARSLIMKKKNDIFRIPEVSKWMDENAGLGDIMTYGFAPEVLYLHLSKKLEKRKDLVDLLSTKALELEEEEMSNSPAGKFEKGLREGLRDIPGVKMTTERE